MVLLARNNGQCALVEGAAAQDRNPCPLRLLSLSVPSIAAGPQALGSGHAQSADCLAQLPEPGTQP